MKIFWSFARQAFHSTAIYRFDFWLRLANNFIWMYSAYWLWTILYTQKAGAFDVSLEQMVTYGVLSQVISMVLRPGVWVSYVIASKVKNGEIIMDMLKPLDFHVHTLARSIGEVLFFTAFVGAPSLLVAFLFLKMQLPPNLTAGLLFIASLVLGYGVQFSLSFLLGLLSVFTIDIRNISWAYSSVIRFFSGSEVPLWLFPVFLSKLADALPFKCIFAVPLSIYIGKFTAQETASAFALQIFWLAALTLAGRWVWVRAHAYLSVQGG